jgi:protein tyrosine phosphatase domain-containing protein 1
MAHVTTVEGRKIAVHCHAGLGRTGLSIACYFVFMGMYDAKSAVVVTRKRRPGALQVSGVLEVT